jgi:hypothetical protein
MKHFALPLRTLGLTLALLWGGSGPAAADRCQPRAPLGVDSLLEFHLEDSDQAPRLQARLVQALKLNMPLSSFGVGSEGSTTLQRDVPVTGQAIGLGVVDGDLAVLKLAPDAQALRARQGAQRFEIRIDKGKARDADGNELSLSPDLLGLGGFELVHGATVRGAGTGKVIVDAGATLSWSARAAAPLKTFLARPARLAETAAEGAAVTAQAQPERLAPGAKVTVRLDAKGLDLRALPPTFCFAGAGGAAGGEAGAVQFVRQESDAAVFEMRLPGKLAAQLVEGRPWWERVRGVPVQLRSIAYANGHPVLDQGMEVILSSARWAIAVGVAVLLLLYLCCAAFMGMINPLAITGELIRQSSGRYSLSNLQVLLWSLLVIFALTFAWVSSGQLLPLSTGVLALLGIAGGSSVLSRGVESLDTANPPPAVQQEPDRRNLVFDKQDRFDLLRFQMLGFTLFSLLYSLWSVLRSDGLPEIPDTLYWLMGISNTTYVAGKASARLGNPAPTSPAADTPPADALTPAEKALAPDRIRALQAKLPVDATGTLDSATRDAVAAYKARNNLYPASRRVNEALLQRLGV